MHSNPDRAILLESLRASRRAMARDFLSSAIDSLRESDITVVQMGTLMLLEGGDAWSVKSMSEQLGRSLSATSRLLDQLVRRGLIKRWEDTEDRRVRLIGIAPAGQRLLGDLMDRRTDAQMQLMELLTERERQQVVRAMALLQKAAERRNQDAER